MADQSNDLWRLRLAGEKRAWTKMSSGPRLQGLALVAFDKYLYRLGGFTARNKKGDEHDLWSQSGVARFDPVAKTWTKMPPLPEPRSSFDAAVVGDAIYVAGGWQMQGDGESVWHKTAYRLNLKGEPKWETLPEPPFQRRALALAAHGGRLYAIGGMQQKGGPTTRVDIFDPQAKKWSQGPALRGEPLTGFGSSSFATGGRLYVSAVDGSLQRLSKDGRSWESLKGLKTGRFFHRMLPLDERRLLVVGGANMSIGKVVETKVLAAD
jgi:hypothetical protein